MDVVQALSRDEVDITTLGVDTVEKVLELAADRYYNTGDAIISDNVFDDIREVLQAKDPSNRFLQTRRCPGGGVQEGHAALSDEIDEQGQTRWH